MFDELATDSSVTGKGRQCRQGFNAVISDKFLISALRQQGSFCMIQPWIISIHSARYLLCCKFVYSNSNIVRDLKRTSKYKCGC